ncbi:MAG: GTP cyclohydrolase I FolE [Melioribacteraceae bacterium]|nr:GTP cyclohydrolase I FolE [Melioribacteraceae bacterium]MCF8264070.1 GTP cyclohydrolase I FolE [Melioribacteraceae bacterium]MCF8413127.1 GTP cyclohydrolase I FolE [Melioribacteraceae bacterium]MCF8430839.1 GTP cyclohydrolase I FolE [Melioribacteraceae bacterium]
MGSKNFNTLRIEEIGEAHVGTSYETPLRKDAFEKDDKTKEEIIQNLFEQIMITMGLDLTDDSLKGTPKRVAKMFVNEIFSGLNPANKPEPTVFDNKYKYKEMVVEKNIIFHSTCEHHFLPIFGNAHVAYISSGKVIGLSKLNRIVDYYAKRPQVQERMTIQIANELKDVLNTDDVAVVVEGKHLCVSARGINDTDSTTITAEYSGKFEDENVKKEFLSYINNNLIKNS